MKVYDNCPKPGRIWSIEVPSRIGRRRLVRIIAAIPGVHVFERPGILSRFSDRPFLQFRLGEHRFVVESTWPAGDRFEITPEPRGCVEALLVIREALIDR
jgi:hypothetical protein